MTGIASLPNTSNADQVISAIERDGVVVIENFLSPSELAGLQADLLPRLSRQSTGRDAFIGANTRRLGALFAHTRRCAEIVTHPLYLPVAEHFLKKPHEVWSGERRFTVTPEVRIGFAQAIQIGPGNPAQPLHRDDSSLMWRHPTNGREGRVQIMLAISDFTEGNGATLVIPGSHLWDDERKPERSLAVPAVMKVGSAAMFVGSTYHAGGHNRTTHECRTGLSIGLDVSHVRQEENMYLTLPSEVVASYPEQIQRLLGWSAGDNSMGWVEIDGQLADPIHLLKGSDPSTLVGVTSQVKDNTLDA